MEVRDSQHLSAPSYSRLISPRESFGLQNNSSQSQSPAMQNMRLEFSSDGTPVYKPLSSQYTGGGAVGSGNGAAAPTFVQQGIGMSMDEPMKRKRGRPRKYEPDGKIAIPVTTVSQASAAVPHLGGSGFSSLTQSQSSMKKARGRPPGSGKKHQMAALGAAGVGFTPHVITVKAGERNGGCAMGARPLNYNNLPSKTLTCSSSGCEHNWSAFEHIHTKRRNRLEQKWLNDLVYIRYNQILHHRYEKRDNINPISLKDINESNKWLTGMMDSLDLDEGGDSSAQDLVFDDEDLNWAVVSEAMGVDEPQARARAKGKAPASNVYQRRRRTMPTQVEEEEEEFIDDDNTESDTYVEEEATYDQIDSE